MIHVCAIFCRRLADSDITVTPSVKCMDWLQRWYYHAAHSVSSSTALAFLNNTSENRKSATLIAIQVKNWNWREIGRNKQIQKGWMKCYIYCNVRLAHSSILTICDNAMLREKTQDLGWKESVCEARLQQLYRNGFIHSFMPLACAEYDNSLPFSGASYIPLCYIPFSTNQSSILPHFILPSISWSISQPCCFQVYI